MFRWIWNFITLHLVFAREGKRIHRAEEAQAAKKARLSDGIQELRFDLAKEERKRRRTTILNMASWSLWLVITTLLGAMVAPLWANASGWPLWQSDAIFLTNFILAFGLMISVLQRKRFRRTPTWGVMLGVHVILLVVLGLTYFLFPLDLLVQVMALWGFVWFGGILTRLLI